MSDFFGSPALFLGIAGLFAVAGARTPSALVGTRSPGRLDDLAHSGATLAEAVTPESVALLKDRIAQQVPPIVHQLADIATSRATRKQIGTLIKREVDEYYQQLSLFKKIFISRERIHREVDDLMNKTPKRVKVSAGEAFEQGPRPS